MLFQSLNKIVVIVVFVVVFVAAAIVDVAAVVAVVFQNDLQAQTHFIFQT